MADEFLAHIGVLHKSGRYPWGSGANPHQRNRMFLDTVDALKKGGMSDAEIAKSYDMTTTDLRAYKSIALNEQRQARVSQALRLKDKGMSNVAIGKLMGIPESSVRSLLNPSLQEKNDILAGTASILRDAVTKDGMIDVGLGVERHLGISKEKLATATAMLKAEGYVVITVQEPQLGTSQKTLVKVLAPPGTTYKDIVTDKGRIKNLSQVKAFSEDGGRSYTPIRTPENFDSKRLAVRYGDEGGSMADGVMYIRPGVPELSLGSAGYVQARVAVDGTHYIKGMAMYRDDMPDGVDIMFNTNKTRAEIMASPDYNGDVKVSALKKLKNDPDLPFGAIIKQQDYIDSKGKSKLSPINIVNDEGDWDDWSRSLSSQMLSKQQPALAKTQLDMTFQNKKAQYDEIMSLTNPAVKKKMLEEFADSADAASVHLKAAALPAQKTHVILPFSSMKEDEIYAPNYNNGDRVVLIRYPHGGIFEIPELTVNNKHRLAKDILGNAKAAVGINPKVAEKLSGADFDGDTVLVIPNKPAGVGRIQTKATLEGLKGFDPRTSYPMYEGMKIMSNTQQEMGNISNLITDMTIKKAHDDELVRAVRHSMVVIDAEKHKLNYKQSAKDMGIAALKVKYQGGADRGASTLISKASSEERVDQRKLRKAKDGGPIDPVTGEKVYVPTGEGYIKRTTSKRTGVVTEKFIPLTDKSTKMAEVRDAHDLSSGTVMEKLYADHANRLKALANQARKETLNITSTPVSPSAKAAYRSEVASLNAKLNTALSNAPLERQAQLVGNAQVRAKQQANPDMSNAELKKVRAQALKAARDMTGAKKNRIEITQAEWDAIQAGAISNNQLTQILRNADPDQVKQLALPRQGTVMNSSMLTRAKAMAASGYSQAEIAASLGVPPSTLSSALKKGESA